MASDHLDLAADLVSGRWYVGWCRVVPRPGQPSYLHVFAKLSGDPNESDTAIQTIPGLPGPGFEPAKVNWPAESPFLDPGLAYQPLAFRVDPSSDYGKDIPGMRWYRLQKDSMENWVIQQFGCLVLDVDPESSQSVESRIRACAPIFTKRGERLVGPWKNVAEREHEIRLAPLSEDPSCILGWKITELTSAPAEVQIGNERVFLLPHQPPVERAEVLADANRIWKPLEDAIFKSPGFERLLARKIESEIRSRALELAAQTNEVSVELIRNLEAEVDTLSSRASTLRTEVAELEKQISSLAALIPLRHVSRRWPRSGTSATDLRHWVEFSLATHLSYYLSSGSYDLAEEVAVAYLGCRCLLVPDSGYAVAFCHASGGEAELLMVPAEPHWISWLDCWAPEMASFWEAATRNPSTLYVMHFQDLDHSMAGLWGRPFWNLVSGLVDGLPDSRFLGWPPNLRLSASIAKDEASFPLPVSLLRNFGAILSKAEPAGQSLVRPVPLQLPELTWVIPATPVELSEQLSFFGSAASLAALEIARLEQLLVACGRPHHEARRRAVDVRVSAPLRLQSQGRQGSH